MKKYTEYSIPTKFYSYKGFSGASRKQINDLDEDINNIIKLENEAKENNYTTYTYKIIDNTTKEIVFTLNT